MSCSRLHKAVQDGNLELVRQICNDYYLVKLYYGDDINKKNEYGKMILLTLTSRF